ncbi:MAG: hypothetical protein Q8Q20_03595 [bacterium]|nr:hypothetical protein [bacterium]
MNPTKRCPVGIAQTTDLTNRTQRQIDARNDIKPKSTTWRSFSSNDHCAIIAGNSVFVISAIKYALT